MSMRWLVILGLSFAGLAQASDPAALPPRERFHLYLLVGQSNMAGRGTVDDEGRAPHPRVLMLDKHGAWVPAVDPLHFDKPVAGVGLGKTFGTLLAQADESITIGLIPCAVGGSPIDSWQPGVHYAPTDSHPWDDAMRRAHAALRAGVLKGILWHQGESDATAALAESYESKLHDLIARLRKELEAPHAFFVAGQLGQFPDAPWDEPHKIVDQAHRRLPERVPHTAFVSSEGLRHKGDKVHFDTPSYRELGRRYAEAYRRLLTAAQP